MSTKEDLLRSLSVKKLRELAQQNKVLLVYRDPWSFSTKKMPAKNKEEIIAVLSESRKLSKKKVEAKVFGVSRPKSSSSIKSTKIKVIKRRSLAKAEKTMILDSQRHNCADCKMDISKMPQHFDHRIPLALLGSNDLANIQALCPNCHAIKTQRDALAIAKAARARRS